jgi:hypothetical protein
MVFPRHTRESIVVTVLAIVMTTLAITTWAFSPNPKSNSAAPIPQSEAIYQAQHWNAY